MQMGTCDGSWEGSVLRPPACSPVSQPGCDKLLSDPSRPPQGRGVLSTSLCRGEAGHEPAEVRLGVDSPLGVKIESTVREEAFLGPAVPTHSPALGAKAGSRFRGGGWAPSGNTAEQCRHSPRPPRCPVPPVLSLCWSGRGHISL